MTSLPLEIEREVLKYSGKIFQIQNLYGGDINQVKRLICEKGDLVIKFNNSPKSQMFAKEAQGLALLAQYQLPVPSVIAVGNAYLLLPYYPPGPRQPEIAGRLLAQLHAQAFPNCGLNFDNFIGSLPQKNTPSASWVNFYHTYRLQAQLNQLGCLKAHHPDAKLWHQLLEKLPSIVTEPEQFSLIHGDLWSGNLYYSSQGPLFIDPAPYVGDRLVEIAFTELFGGFPSNFYAAYREILPLGERYQHLKKLYQLYPLLVHANLFGASYYYSAKEIALYYVSQRS